MKEVAIDNDFVMHLAEIDWLQEELNDKVRILFLDIKVIPIMHELVYINELENGADCNNKTRALSFFSHGIMRKKEMSSFLDTNAKKKFYEIVLKEIYRDFKGDFPKGINDVFKDWRAQTSLGETHTVAMCFIIGCDLFLSDDDDSKKLARILENKRAFKVNVYKREEVIDNFKAELKDLNKHDRRTIKHVPK